MKELCYNSSILFKNSFNHTMRLLSKPEMKWHGLTYGFYVEISWMVCLVFRLGFLEARREKAQESSSFTCKLTQKT